MDFSLFCALTFLQLLAVASGVNREIACAVCRAVVDEVNYSISKIDPKKTIQVGSFRVDPQGNQKTYEKPYARSEVHLLEVFENVCENFKDYAETNNDAGQKSIGRTKARDGKVLALKGISVSADIQKQMKFACESLVEEHEEEMISLFTRENQPDMEQTICGSIARLCSEADLRIPMPVTEYPAEDIDRIKAEAKDEKEEPSDEEEEKVVMSDGNPEDVADIIDKEEL